MAHRFMAAARGGRVLTVDFSQKTAWDLERLEPNNFFRFLRRWCLHSAPAWEPMLGA